MQNYNLRQELQSYFDRVYPNSKIDGIFDIPVHVRFELGANLRNGTKKAS
jgi:hypothetical protein